MGRWKDGAQAALCLTFDFDAESLWLNMDPEHANHPGILSLGTYGANVGVPLILETLRQRDVTGTFFIPGWVAEQHPQECRAIRAAGHEIGHHGYLHESVNTLSPEAERDVLVKGINALQNVVGVKPVGYRSPSWETSKATVGLLQEHGIRYASNFADNIRPYRHKQEGREVDLVELPIQWMLDDAPFFMYHGITYRCIYPTSHVFEIWSEELQAIWELGGICVLAMHPQFIGRPSRVKMLGKFIDFAKSLPGLWITTGGEAADWYLAHGC